MERNCSLHLPREWVEAAFSHRGCAPGLVVNCFQCHCSDLSKELGRLHQGQEVCCILECKQKYWHIVSPDDFKSTFLSVWGWAGGPCMERFAMWVGLCWKKEPFQIWM